MILIIGLGGDLTLVKYPQQRCYGRKVFIINIDASNIAFFNGEKCELCGFCFDSCHKIVKVSKWYRQRKPNGCEGVPGLRRRNYYFHTGCFNNLRIVKRLA